MIGAKGLKVTGAAGPNFLAPAGTEPGHTHVLCSLLGAQLPGDVSSMAELVIRCHKGDLVLALELAANLLM